MHYHCEIVIPPVANIDWDGKLLSALAKYRDKLKNYTEEFAARADPKHDWLVVTVDYHS